MRTLLLKFAVAALLLSLPAAVRAQTNPPPVAASAADRDLAAFQAIQMSAPPTELKQMGRQAMYQWADTTMQKLCAAGLAFYERYPADPRRWEIVKALNAYNPPFVKTYGPKFDTLGIKDAVVDEVAKAAWQAKLAALNEAMQGEDKVYALKREEEDYAKFEKDFLADADAMRAGRPVDWTSYRARFDAHVAKYGQLGVVMVARADDYLFGLERMVPGAALNEWAHLSASSPCAALRERAADTLKLAERMGKPLELTFTAVDGRKVDLAALRGKVVLVQFWATWCEPFVGELPAVKAAYAAYRDQGFEVVGITLENAQLGLGDTTEQKTAKLAKAKAVLNDFTRAHAMPWPQYFDGKWWQNDIFTGYQLRTIPVMFLLNRQGKIVSRNAWGPELDRQVRQLLKL